MKKIKWLKYFIESWEPHPTFVYEMEKQLKPQFEEHFGRELNWDRLWLFNVPLDGVMDFIINDNNYVVKFNCALIYGYAELKCVIEWYQFNSNEFFDVKNEIKDNQVVITLTQLERDDYWMKLFPGKNDKIGMKRFPTNAYFTTFIEGRTPGHEGYFDFQAGEEETLDQLKLTAEQAYTTWNDESIIIENTEEYRGKLHQLYYDGAGEEENSIRFYYDAGSSIDEIFAFLLEYIGERVEGIEQVVIRGEE